MSGNNGTPIFSSLRVRDVHHQAETLLTVSYAWLMVHWAQILVAIGIAAVIVAAVEHRALSEEYSGEAIGSAMGIIRLLVTFVLFAIALIVVLDNLGVSVTGLVAGLGVGGIAIGLAAQGIFADLFAALAIIFDKPFRKGDTITFGPVSGSVENIGLKTTRLRSVTGEEVVVANSKLLDQ